VLWVIFAEGGQIITQAQESRSRKQTSLAARTWRCTNNCFYLISLHILLVLKT
jgi:hypothetical protein